MGHDTESTELLEAKRGWGVAFLVLLFVLVVYPLSVGPSAKFGMSERVTDGDICPVGVFVSELRGRRKVLQLVSHRALAYQIIHLFRNPL